MQERKLLCFCESLLYFQMQTMSEKKDSEKIVPFSMTLRRTDYLGIGLTKDMKDRYAENLENRKLKPRMGRYPLLRQWKN